MTTAITSTRLVSDARAWATRLGRGRTAELLTGLCDALERQGPRTRVTDIPFGYVHAARELDALGDRLPAGRDRSTAHAGALFITELAAEVFQGKRGPA